MELSTNYQSIHAWIASGYMDAKGQQCKPDKAVLKISAVCVHEDYPARVKARLDLIREVLKEAEKLAKKNQIPRVQPHLWVFPAGYFGFAAGRYARAEDKDKAPKEEKDGDAWIGLDEGTFETLESDLRKIAEGFQAWLAVGVDDGRQRQQAWIVPATSKSCLKIGRGDQSTLRYICIGQVRAAIYVCGEIIDSQTTEEPEDIRLLIDLAHSRVMGSKQSGPNQRMAFQRRMEDFAARGTAVLAHHHAGQRVGNGYHFCHQSNWLIFRGNDQWLDPESVVEVPASK